MHKRIAVPFTQDIRPSKQGEFAAEWIQKTLFSLDSLESIPQKYPNKFYFDVKEVGPFKYGQMCILVTIQIKLFSFLLKMLSVKL